jgi:hypothetical protein
VREQAVQAPVELMDLGQFEPRPEQVRHGACREPLPMTPPLAAGSDEPVGGERLQDQVPARAFAARRESAGPEGVQPELRVQVARQPARAPLPGAPHREIPEADLDRGVIRHLGDPVFGKQGQAARVGGAVLEDLDGLAPGLPLAVIDLAQVEDRALHHAPAAHAPGLDEAPVPMRLAVFVARVTAQEHRAATLPLGVSPGREGRSSLQAV